jgi:hypothetical protein
MLPSSVADALADDVIEALGQISPVYGVSSVGPWQAALLDGAMHSSNVVQAMALGSCIDQVGRLFIDRPWIYFGVPAVELVDAHWFAYRAAKAHYLKIAAK